MKISLNWIKDYVDLSGIDENEIIKRYTLSTAEIEDVYHLGENTSGVVFAKILKVEEHPNSQKLHILSVDKGDEVVQIVCGAPNVREGMVTALATLGARVNGQKISKAKLAGVESFGMCCAEAELGIGSDDNGIMDIKEDVTIGQDIKSIWPIDDTIIEIDNKSLTNRPDLWGHYGQARELAAIFGRELKKPEIVDIEQYKFLPKLDVKVENSDCYRYSSISVDNVTKKVSPITMKIRLNYTGMRDINLLTDLTNYVMLDLGQPMHAFDHNIVKGIRVVKANKNTELMTLEGEKHMIPEGAVVIDNDKYEPVAIAGIKGGMLSGITDKTTSLLLESATFNPSPIRKTSIEIGLRTDASLRYEKSLDPEITTIAIARLLKLLMDIDTNARVTSSLTDCYEYHYPTHKIDITADFISRRTGISVSNEDIIAILRSLGFDVKEDKGIINVIVPSHRGTKDVSIKEDLVEEVARMYGYDNIRPVSLNMMVTPALRSRESTCEYQSKCLLAEKYNMNEVHSYIWNYADFNKQYGIESASFVNLVDSSNSGQSGVRNSMVPTLIKMYEENKNNYPEIRIFEIGRVITGLDDNKHSIEEKHLGVLLASTTDNEEVLYFELKKMINNLAKDIIKTLEPTYKAGEVTNHNYHPVNSCKIYVGDTEIGEMGIMHPSIKIDKRFKVAFAEIDFAKWCQCEEQVTKLTNVSKYQTVSLDFNFVVDKDMIYAEIDNIIKQFRAKYDIEYTLKDMYENAITLPGKRSYTFTFNITSQDHTLTGEEIDKFSSRLIKHMEMQNITLR